MHFKAGEIFDFGTISFSEDEIVKFAKEYDPLDFHIHREAALSSIFKGYVASGPHAFHHFYINQWIPLFGKTVLAGLEINHWLFLKPIYPNQKVHCTVTISNSEEFTEKKSTAVTWKFEFKNDDKDLFQHLTMKVLHKTAQP